MLRLKQAIEPGQVLHHPDRKYPNRKTELDWIARNRNQYQGKWLALIGDQLIAAEGDARMLLGKLKQQKLSETPLVVKVWTE